MDTPISSGWIPAFAGMTASGSDLQHLLGTRQRDEVERAAHYEGLRLPPELDYLHRTADEIAPLSLPIG